MTIDPAFGVEDPDPSNRSAGACQVCGGPLQIVGFMFPAGIDPREIPYTCPRCDQVGECGPNRTDVPYE